MSNSKEIKKIEWLKVSLGGKVKRIYNPSKDLKCLSNQIKSHFKELGGYSLTTNNHLGEQEFVLQWVPSGNLPITITDNDQLEEIYFMHGLSDDAKVPRFEVNAGLIWFSLTESIKNSELRNSSLIEDDNNHYQSAAPFSGKNQHQANDYNPYLRCLEEIEERLESQESEDALSEDFNKSSDSSNSSDEDDELLLFQQLKHSIRNQVEKEVLHRLEELKMLQNVSEYSYEEQKQQQHPLSSSIDIKVSFLSNRSSEVVQSNPIFSRIRSFFQKHTQDFNPLHQALIQSQKELYIEVAPNTRCTLRWSIKNESHQEWPQGLSLVSVFSSPEIQMNSQPINHQLLPQESSDIDIVLFIPQDFRDSAQLVMFRIISDEGRFIGEPFLAYIKIMRGNNEDSAIQDSGFGFLSDYRFMQEVPEEQLLEYASFLVDEGYGTFDRSYNILKCLRGDVQKARECLSLLIFHECQV